MIYMDSSEPEYVELTGDDIPYHLRLDAPPLTRCDACGSQSWSVERLWTTCNLTQPDGSKCSGFMRDLRPPADDPSSAPAPMAVRQPFYGNWL